VVASRRVSAPFAPSCVNHPSTPPRGLCVHCRGAFCAECLTKVDGINHCARCYAEAAQAARERAAWRAPEASPGHAAYALLCLWLLAWGLAELGFGVAGPFR
jgi:hypothetical protein